MIFDFGSQSGLGNAHSVERCLGLCFFFFRPDSRKAKAPIKCEVARRLDPKWWLGLRALDLIHVCRQKLPMLNLLEDILMQSETFNGPYLPWGLGARGGSK